MREIFYKNVAAIENTFFNSESFKYLTNSGLDKDAIAGVVAEIFKQAIMGAVNLEELELKAKSESLAYEKARMEINFNILNAKAQIKTAQAEAVKSLVQAKAMVRSVVDNAAIQRSNQYIGLSNVIGNATEQKALTAPDMSGGATGGIAALAIENIEKIDITAIADFDDMLKKLIDDDKFITKDVIIFAPKQVVAKGEIIALEGISSFAKNEFKFLLNGELVAENTRNFLFEAKELGDFAITFLAKNDDDDFISDTLTLKVIENDTLKQLPPIKKF